MRVRSSDDNDRDLESGRVSPPRYSSLSVHSREAVESPGGLDVEMDDLSRRPTDNDAATQRLESTQQEQEQQPQICANCGWVGSAAQSEPTAMTTTAITAAASQPATGARQQQNATTTTTSHEYLICFSDFMRGAMVVLMVAWVCGVYIKITSTKQADGQKPEHQKLEDLKYVLITLNAVVAMVCSGFEMLLRLPVSPGIMVYFWGALWILTLTGGLVPWL